MSLIETILLVAGLILGAVAVIESQFKNWAGWGVIAIAAALLLAKYA